MKFKIGKHSIRPGVEVVEVFDDQGVFVAQIVPSDDGCSIKVISKYATGTVFEDRRIPNVSFDGRRARSFVFVLAPAEAPEPGGPA